MKWNVVIDNLPKLLDGAVLTLELVAISVTLGLLLAIPMGIARASRLWYVRALPYGYIFLFRGTPLLVQLFLVYYGLSQFDAIRNSVFWSGFRFNHEFELFQWSWEFKWAIPGLRNAFTCAVLTMTLHSTAYIAEIIRGAIQAVPKGEVEAARALGFSRAKTMWYILLPRAARIGLPAYGNEVILMLKGSALASTVTLMELTGAARTLSAKTYLQAEFFLAAGVIYLVISFVLIQILKWIERWLRVDACRGT